jgi:hypothetical protein
MMFGSEYETSPNLSNSKSLKSISSTSYKGSFELYLINFYIISLINTCAETICIIVLYIDEKSVWH